MLSLIYTCNLLIQGPLLRKYKFSNIYRFVKLLACSRIYRKFIWNLMCMVYKEMETNDDFSQKDMPRDNAFVQTD